MGRKDIIGKDFFADRRRFAELLNTVLYQGEEIIHAEELEPLARVYPSLSGKGEAGRDVFMRDAGQNICYGLELETESDYGMPERVMVYDACELEQQIREISRKNKEDALEIQGEMGIAVKPQNGWKGDRTEPRAMEKFNYREKKSRIKETDFLLPTVTVVLYLGIDHWEGKQKLSELYRIPEGLLRILGKRLPDYGFPMAEADFIDPDHFKTDLKEFFQAMQCRKDRKKLKELLRTESFQHLDRDAARAIAAHLGREQLTVKVEKGGLGMCPAMEEWAEEERMEGRKEGEISERLAIIRNMIREGMDQEIIRKVTGCSLKELASAAKG